MLHFLALWLLNAVAFVVTASIVPGLRLEGFTAALLAAPIMGIVNTLVRPVLVILTLPITVLTLGLFLLVVNALCLMLASWLTPGFAVRSFWSALLGAVVLSVVSYGLHYLAASV